MRQRLDEGTTEVEQRPEKFIAVGEPSSTVRRVIAARSVKKIEPFLRKELPKYHDDEEVDLDEFEDVEAEIEEEEWWCESDGEEEIPERNAYMVKRFQKVDHHSLQVKNWQK